MAVQVSSCGVQDEAENLKLTRVTWIKFEVDVVYTPETSPTQSHTGFVCAGSRGSNLLFF